MIDEPSRFSPAMRALALELADPEPVAPVVAQAQPQAVPEPPRLVMSPPLPAKDPTPIVHRLVGEAMAKLERPQPVERHTIERVIEHRTEPAPPSPPPVERKLRRPGAFTMKVRRDVKNRISKLFVTAEQFVETGGDLDRCEVEIERNETGFATAYHITAKYS